MKYISGIYGLLKGVIEAMLVFMHNLTGNFGLAIIGVTILMKIILLPLTLKLLILCSGPYFPQPFIVY